MIRKVLKGVALVLYTLMWAAVIAVLWTFMNVFILDTHAAADDVIMEIHTEPFAGALDITEPCPAELTETTAEAPEATEKVETIYGGISISEDEYALLRSILALEADYDTEGHDGQKAVVEVIFNRVLSDKWPNTVEDVIYQRGQFATVKYLKKPYNLPGEHEDDAISAVLRETETVLPDTTYVYFDTKGVNGRKHVRIKHHVFGR